MRKTITIVVLSILCALLIGALIYEKNDDNETSISQDSVEQTLFQQPIPKEIEGNYLIGIKTLEGNYRAQLTLYQAENGEYKDLYSCPAVIGKNGKGKQTEGDLKTPLGTYTIGQAYGINGNPGFKISIPYSEITEDMYWCSDGADYQYNKLIYSTDDSNKDYSKDKRLTDYPGYYKYMLEIKFNPECIPYAGSAIFLHTWENPNTPTDGGIGISENDLKNVLGFITPETQIVIY